FVPAGIQKFDVVHGSNSAHDFVEHNYSRQIISRLCANEKEEPDIYNFGQLPKCGGPAGERVDVCHRFEALSLVDEVHRHFLSGRHQHVRNTAHYGTEFATIGKLRFQRLADQAHGDLGLPTEPPHAVADHVVVDSRQATAH